MALFDPRVERDNCGFGLMAHLDGHASHKLLRLSMAGLARMQHRGGIGSDGKTGDGCGLLIQKPDSFFRAIAAEQGWHLGRNYAVGMLFLSPDPALAEQSRREISAQLQQDSLHLVGWREVPINRAVLGPIASASLPRIEQVFIAAPPGWQDQDLERRLYIVRRRIEQKMAASSDPHFYIASLSGLVCVYKGLCMAHDLPQFYQDLSDIRLQTAICVFHQRFSTNTSPRWALAQPFRYLAHNGEINTIAGNRQWARARGYKFATPLIPDLQTAAPFVSEDGSDSSSLDNMLELFLAGGMDLFRAMRLLMPPAWQKHPHMDDDLRAFYDFNSMHMEPWDGPAGVVLTDGRYASCALDRNGLRPARYVITQDRLLTLASEVGIWDYAPDEVLEKGRVGPGELFVVDTQLGKVWSSFAIDNELKSRHPYRQWLSAHCQKLTPAAAQTDAALADAPFSRAHLLREQKRFGISYEELDCQLRVLGEQGQEAVGSMGDDAPLAVLSGQARCLYDYFRQMFAQVTNPPIDPLRENHVMSLATCIGREQNVFNETFGHAHRVQFASPILRYSDFQQLLTLTGAPYRQQRLSLGFSPALGLAAAIDALCAAAKTAAQNGHVLLVLSDRDLMPDLLPIPAAMAVGAVQRTLVDNNLRCDANLLVETATCRDPHHFAVLLGLGATAIYPYLAYASLTALVEEGAIALPLSEVLGHYQHGIEKGLYKIMSKMGISTIASYRCAQLFEIIGLDSTITDRCFAGVSSRIGGANFADIGADLLALQRLANAPSQPLPLGGLLKFTPKGEFHAYNPDVVQLLQQAVKSGAYSDYQRYATCIAQRPTAALRDLLQLETTHTTPLTLDQVQSAQTLYQRFDSAAMSIGALSPEAHEALAMAMNRLGGQSNSGEGGEDPARFGTEKNSRIKQLASGRFGVTAHYLINADVVQIKIAQGAKPGEGGQLPGDKVTALIAKLRYSVPGVTLISPPPHHDIYSIEDLAQLIFDLKQLNPACKVSVKLVSEPGVGTIACGVAKAYADFITISGYDGGTGASPLSSVKHAGSPWELGLAEAHQALVANGLRHKVRLQVDGGLKTGQDIIKAAILGAESFGFGTGPMVALGCKYLRICHLNNCATGIATQDDTLRRDHFTGLPERVMNYFNFIAHETRELLAALGVADLRELIGRTDLLTRRPGHTARQAQLDLSALLQATPCQLAPDTPSNTPFDTGRLNALLLQELGDAVHARSGGAGHYAIQNFDRSVGASLSGLIAATHGNQGMAGAPLVLHFNGSAGQSFGVWNVGGLVLHLTGDANDYVGKGMTGGLISLKPHAGVSFASHEAVIAGNTCLYGATGGQLYAAGIAGERFAVRNSGAVAVVEGVGDNGCEYMTGGVVTVLGSTGVNFAAGMTGGFAYLYDAEGDIAQRINPQGVEWLAVANLPTYAEHLRGQLQAHVAATGSQRAQMLLDDFTRTCQQFWLVKPKSSDLKRLLGHPSRSSAELRIEAA
ncbi:MAG: glutamate synthase large subunit [Aeromonas sp.]